MDLRCSQTPAHLSQTYAYSHPKKAHLASALLLLLAKGRDGAGQFLGEMTKNWQEKWGRETLPNSRKAGTAMKQDLLAYKCWLEGTLEVLSLISCLKWD